METIVWILLFITTLALLSAGLSREYASYRLTLRSDGAS
jgi:hypothetical protein